MFQKKIRIKCMFVQNECMFIVETLYYETCVWYCVFYFVRRMPRLIYFLLIGIPPLSVKLTFKMQIYFKSVECVTAKLNEIFYLSIIAQWH